MIGSEMKEKYCKGCSRIRFQWWDFLPRCASKTKCIKGSQFRKSRAKQRNAVTSNKE